MTNDFDNAKGEALAELDALLAGHENSWWDSFYDNRAKPCPFFGTFPDESLANWIDEGLVRPGRALDLGCGNGRNAIFLSRSGFATEAVDYSQTAIDWARERATEAGVDMLLRHQSVFELQLEAGSYDLVYDSGCFHHIPPHRRNAYVALVSRALKPGGLFGLACFRPEGGSGYWDQEVYERRSMGGGLGYAEERLREIWSSTFRVRVLRRMNKPSTESGLFGEPFLWALLAQKM
ncbi:MAG: class I SAM-dependent methyltransferase [Rhodoferax sp.]|uniref:class I SAM-dependent methyltransferase n=1 Tax=Rhodoferax sp. TaxID=50421 RepID=UPI002609BC97|nr:class I SAM-dependent methyltransferase [Rhodoferax sp.]MDD5335223.1 class I SAM-dependent methyltransferase [Rhodoferax sp.]